MPTPEAKNTIKQTPEQIKQAQEATDRTKIKNAPAVKVAEKIKDTNIPQSKDIKDNAITPIKIENIKAQEVRKDTDLVIKRFPDLNTQVMRTILTQYHILKWDSGSQDAIGLDKLSLKQIYNLPMTTKANLAYLSSMIAHGPTVANYKKIAESDYMKQNKLSASAIANTIWRMNEWNPMGPSDLNFIRAFKSELEDIQQTEILQKFINMFPDGETVPPMPEIKQFAVGMGRTTWGLGGVENGSRWLFDYNNSAESPSLNSKNLEFGFDETKPMSISIIPSWSQSTKPSTINLLIKDQTGKTLGTVTGSYRRNESGRWNIFKLDSNPSLPDISVINNTINIPNTYKNASITLTAQAANIYWANYDEANFSLSIENGRTIDPTEKAHTWSVASYEEHITDPMELGKFELTPDAKVKISSIVDKSLWFWKIGTKGTYQT